MLVFDEKKHYEKIMENGFEKYPNKRDLSILCKFWILEGTSIDCLKDKIIYFCKKWNPHFNYAKSEPMILEVLNSFIEVKKENAFEFNPIITIYSSELDAIKKLKDYKLSKLAFVLVCLAKWRNANYIYLNSLSSIKLKDVFLFAEIKGTGKEYLLFLNKLKNLGFIDVQLKPILKCFIPCIEEDGEIFKEFSISDDMVNVLKEEILPHCQRCGNPFERITNNQKYCKECAKIVKNEKISEIMRKKRCKI